MKRGVLGRLERNLLVGASVFGMVRFAGCGLGNAGHIGLPSSGEACYIAGCGPGEDIYNGGVTGYVGQEEPDNSPPQISGFWCEGEGIVIYVDGQRVECE
jgi:hypothetical protein